MNINPAFYTGGLVALINALSLLITHFINKKSASNQALKLLMQKELKQMCHEAIEHKSITETELQTIYEMHAAYKGLKGNGYFDAILPRIEKLPIVE